jgi:Fic family protein
MKKIQEQLTWISKTLSGLSKQLDKMSTQIDKTATVRGTKTQAGRKPGRKASGKAAGVRKNTVLDSVFNAIQRSRSGVTIPQLRSKTKLGDRQLSNALYKLTKKGLVHAKSRGIYVKR